ncbi:MAG: sigma-70 family RNA polymerase sigma factor [candidate division Zixibacteria bacterium]|nr:sigma-70 family RNA polymerase sigma factor [candidate division Zixibacteria bacterium]MBU1469358.1 sigma-70 family RNA polymerase sigma factor [candidate division Zixibacteria bacterium]MBU2623967.1 sigma-70 family RNA polymerase sigma factor [candidate division Zixibacteria bacterium]
MAEGPEKQVQDDLLIARALEGDQKAYESLLVRHRKAIFHVVTKIVRNQDEAQDLVQETFMKAFNALASYRSEYRFSTWLYKIAANCAIDFVRKKRIEALSLDRPIQTKDGQVEFELPDRTWDPERNLVRKQKLQSIDEAIDSLPDKYREVIIYRHRDDKSYEEIADILGTPVGTVKARIFRARELLKKKLKSIR